MSLNFQKVEPVTKKTRIVSLLREAILSGDLEPGEAIVETRVAPQFGVGQGLIREALIELEYQGFVERTPFSGTRVIHLTLEDAQQIFDIRMELEPLALRLAGQKAQPETLLPAWELAQLMKQNVAERDLRHFFESNLACRRKVWELAGNRFLVQSLERVVSPLFALYVIREPAHHEALLRASARSVETQELALRALQSGDAERAAQLVRQFLQVTKAELPRLLL